MITLNCGHSYADHAGDIELRTRLICDDCFDAGAPEYHRYVVRIEWPS